MLRMIRSAKFWSAVLATIIAAVPVIFLLRRHDVSADLKQNAITTFLYVVGAIWGIKIAGTAIEDASAKWSSLPAPPTTSASPASPTTSALPASPTIGGTVLTKLPLILVALLGTSFLVGCGPNGTVQLRPPSPTVLLAEAEDAYALALQSIDDAARAHLINHQTAQRILALNQQVHQGFDTAHSLVGQPGFADAVANVQNLVQQLKSVQGTLPSPTTQPSPSPLPS